MPWLYAGLAKASSGPTSRHVGSTAATDVSPRATPLSKTRNRSPHWKSSVTERTVISELENVYGPSSLKGCPVPVQKKAGGSSVVGDQPSPTTSSGSLAATPRAPLAATPRAPLVTALAGLVGLAVLATAAPGVTSARTAARATTVQIEENRFRRVADGLNAPLLAVASPRSGMLLRLTSRWRGAADEFRAARGPGQLPMGGPPSGRPRPADTPTRMPNGLVSGDGTHRHPMYRWGRRRPRGRCWSRLRPPVPGCSCG